MSPYLPTFEDRCGDDIKPYTIKDKSLDTIYPQQIKHSDTNGYIDTHNIPEKEMHNYGFVHGMPPTAPMKHANAKVEYITNIQIDCFHDIHLSGCNQPIPLFKAEANVKTYGCDHTVHKDEFVRDFQIKKCNEHVQRKELDNLYQFSLSDGNLAIRCCQNRHRYQESINNPTPLCDPNKKQSELCPTTLNYQCRHDKQISKCYHNLPLEVYDQIVPQYGGTFMVPTHEFNRNFLRSGYSHDIPSSQYGYHIPQRRFRQNVAQWKYDRNTPRTDSYQRPSNKGCYIDIPEDESEKHFPTYGSIRHNQRSDFNLYPNKFFQSIHESECDQKNQKSGYRHNTPSSKFDHDSSRNRYQDYVPQNGWSNERIRTQPNRQINRYGYDDKTYRSSWGRVNQRSNREDGSQRYRDPHHIQQAFYDHDPPRSKIHWYVDRSRQLHSIHTSKLVERSNKEPLHHTIRNSGQYQNRQRSITQRNNHKFRYSHGTRGIKHDHSYSQKSYHHDIPKYECYKNVPSCKFRYDTRESRSYRDKHEFEYDIHKTEPEQDVNSLKTYPDLTTLSLKNDVNLSTENPDDSLLNVVNSSISLKDTYHINDNTTPNPVIGIDDMNKINKTERNYDKTLSDTHIQNQFNASSIVKEKVMTASTEISKDTHENQSMYPSNTNEKDLINTSYSDIVILQRNNITQEIKLLQQTRKPINDDFLMLEAEFNKTIDSLNQVMDNKTELEANLLDLEKNINESMIAENDTFEINDLIDQMDRLNNEFDNVSQKEEEINARLDEMYPTVEEQYHRLRDIDRKIKELSLELQRLDSLPTYRISQTNR
ncbi:hypothetical protein RF11_05163 [Thelohanellus kitauei]|uniref:Uncharacterized protein n=1 Tax=Thelohanellus kitauei TaxID=669202 RepID=A0A0C2MQ31_THEKT|nr:hypothetical protein RF11_05163 [Thelohanellus kitauei]